MHFSDIILDLSIEIRSLDTNLLIIYILFKAVRVGVIMEIEKRNKTMCNRSEYLYIEMIQARMNSFPF